jgi:hypothetical protein
MIFSLFQKNGCNTSGLHLEEESPPAGFRILLNILFQDFPLFQEMLFLEELTPTPEVV